MTPDEFLTVQPEFHYDENGDPISWAIGVDALKTMKDLLAPGSNTLETGAGVSTVLFAMLSQNHTTICPDGREFDNIRRFCDENAIRHDHVRFEEGRSEFILPTLDIEPIDLCLVDGRHAFPSPAIDWFFGAEALKVGGVMVIDDTQIITGRELSDFMTEHPSWQAIEILDKTSMFRKLDDRVHLGEWNSQPYILNRQG
jgi:predicted O-methyltransferase YrrM